MPYLKIKLTYVLFLASLFLFANPVTVTCSAEEKVAPEAASVTDKTDVQEGSGNAVAERQLPQLEPGEWEPLFEMGENIYPSVVISTATLKNGFWDDKQHIGDPCGTIGIAVRGTEDNCPVKVEISCGNFIAPSVFTCTLAKKETVYCAYPSLDYDYEKLLAVKQTVPGTLIFKVTIGNKPKSEKAVRVQIRPINECVYYFIDSSGNLHDSSYFFAAYVNENHPIVSQILKEAIASEIVDGFRGYSGDKEDVKKEIEAIWETLKKRGVHYTTMAASADDSNPYIGSQYVRLLGESIDYAQANCVDGSVLMASVFRKIGLDVSLIILHDHMFISVNLDKEGKEPIYIETTRLNDSSLDEAMEIGHEEYVEDKDKFDSEKDEYWDYHIANIQDARVAGIMPIKDSSAN